MKNENGVEFFEPAVMRRLGAKRNEEGTIINEQGTINKEREV